MLAVGLVAAMAGCGAGVAGSSVQAAPDVLSPSGWTPMDKPLPTSSLHLSSVPRTVPNQTWHFQDSGDDVSYFGPDADHVMRRQLHLDPGTVVSSLDRWDVENNRSYYAESILCTFSDCDILYDAGLVLSYGHDTVTAYRLSDGVQLWCNQAMATNTSWEVTTVMSDWLFMTDGGQSAANPGSRGSGVVLNTVTGERDLTLPDDLQWLFVGNKLMYALSYADGSLLALEPNPDGVTQLWSLASPAGTLVTYAFTADQIVAYAADGRMWQL